MRRLSGCLFKLLLLPVLAAAVFYAVILVTAPWALHIGGASTPLAVWAASGILHTKPDEAYPFFVLLYPSTNFSRLHVDGLQPTGGIQGSACLCEPHGANQLLKLSGTIYSGWRSTEGSLWQFRLIEPKTFNIGEQQGYFDLYGKWNGTELVMDDRGSSGAPFRSGLRIQRASVSLNPRSFWLNCSSACAGRNLMPR